MTPVSRATPSPLRARREDIPLLVAHFLDKYTPRSGKPIRDVSPEALGVLMSEPGNVRELENIIERSVVLATGPVIHLKDLPVDLVMDDRTSAGPPPRPQTLKEALRQIETHLILRVLENTAGTRSKRPSNSGSTATRSC